jgi:hypothetical protein
VCRRATNIDPTSFSAAGAYGDGRYGDGELSWWELEPFMNETQRATCFLRVIFSVADRDGGGTLNADEVTLFTRCVRLELCLL